MKYIGKADLYVPDREGHLLKEKKGRPFWREYQKDRLDAAFEVCSRWDVAVDAGAHVGIMTRELAKHFGRVVAFEPHPDTFACLLANVGKLPNVTCVNKALGRAAGSVFVEDDVGDNTGNRQVSADAAGTEVELTRLDDFPLEGCGLIKMDVQGYELDVVLGARETLMAFCPTLIVEDEPPGKLKRQIHKPGSAVRQLQKWGAGQRTSVGDDVIMTIDPGRFNEYTKYREKGDYHWQKYETGKMRDVVDAVAAAVNGCRYARVLDVGCGDGVFTARMAGAVGIDTNPVAVRLARRHHVEAHELSAFDAHLLGRFDAVTMFDAFEHMPKQGLLLDRLHAVAPNLHVLNPEPNGSEWHTREFRVNELIDFAAGHGWRALNLSEQTATGKSVKHLVHFTSERRGR